MTFVQAQTHRTSPSARPKDRQIRFDEGRNARGKIGFVIIPNEQTVEYDMIQNAPGGVGVYFSRASMPHEISAPALVQVGDSLAEAARRILPDDKLDVVCFACTSGSVAVGEERTIRELRKGAPTAKATTLITSVRRALEAFGSRSIVIGTPYVDGVNQLISGYFLEQGFEIVQIQGLGLNYDREMIRIAPDYLVEFASQIDRPSADAILISCGALRSLEVVDQIEQKIGKPVVSSNQAMLWHCLRLIGVDDKLHGLGSLFRRF